MGDADELDVQEEFRRAISALQLAQEVLARLATEPDNSIQTLIWERAKPVGNRLTGVELAVVARFLMRE